MNEQERTVWLEKNNISVTTASQNPREIEYMTAVQRFNEDRDNYFALTPLETTRENIVRAALRDQQPTALGGALRGTAAGVVSGVQTLRRLGEGAIMDAANSARYALEKNALTDRIGWINANIKRENYDTQEAYQAARNAELEKYRAELAEVETRYKNVAEFGRNEMNKLKKRQENFLKLSGLSKQEGDGFFYDVGNGAGSLLSALAITAITKSPTAAAALFGGIAGRQGYEEALENGVSPEKALWVGTAAGAAEGVLEKVGLDIFLRGLSARGWSNKIVQRVLGKRLSAYTARVTKNALTEAVQEGSQGGAEEFIMQHFGGREKEFNETAQDIAYQALLGGLVGGGVAGIPYIGKAFAQYSKADLEAIRKEQEAKIKTAEQQEAREQRITPPTPQQAEELARANGTERDAVTAHYNTVLQNGVQKFKDLGADEYTAEWLTANIIAQAGSQESLQEISQMIEDENNPATYSKQDILASAAEFAEAVRATAQELTPELKKQIWDIRDRVKQDALSAGLSEEEANLSATMQQALATVAYQITGVSPAEWYKGREIRFVNRRGDDTSFDFGANVPKENTTEAAQTQEAPAEYDVERDGLPDSFYQSWQVKQQVDLTQAFEDIIQLPPAERAAKAEQALNDLIGRAMDTATPPIQIQVTSGNKFHIKHSNVVLKKGQLKRHQTALTALEKVVNSAHQIDKDGTVDAAHNTRPATIAHKQQVKEYVYFEAPIKIGQESFVVELAAERVKGQDENLLDLYNVHIKRNPAAALKSTLPQGSSTNSIGNKEDFVKGETFYQLAPQAYDKNGKADINTPQFKEWFGDSKVVDKNGRPRVVYHGTNKQFSEFKISPLSKYLGKLGEGIYFTDSPTAAHAYAQEAAQNEGDARTYPVYLAIRRPLVLKDFAQPLPKDMSAYDGIICGKPGNREFVVFRPEQIKSVYNRGPWDKNNPNIFYQQAAQDMFEADPSVAEEVRQNIDDYETGILPIWREINLGNPSVALTEAGVPAYSLKLKQKTIKKDTLSKHSVKIDTFKRLPQLLADPVMVFKSDTVPGSFVAVLNDFDRNGKRLVAAIDPDGTVEVNLIDSVYGKDNAYWFKNQVEKGNLLYIDEKKALQESSRLYLRGVPYKTSINSIRTKEDIVKTRQFNQDENAELDADVEYLYSKFEGKIDKSDIRSILVSRQTAEANKIGGGLERVMRTFQARNTDITEEQIRSIYNYQPVRLGKVKFTGRGPVITLLEGANKSTVAHEMTHVFLRELELLAQKYDTKLMQRHMAKLEAFLGPKQANGFYSEVQHEKLAKGYLDYMRTQEAPNTEMKNIFERFRDFLEELYEDIRGKKLFEKITPAAKEFFDDFLAPLNITTPDAKKFRGKIKEVREAVEDIRKRRLPRAGLGITLQDVKDLYSQIKKRMPKTDGAERSNWREELEVIRATSDSLAAAQDVLEKINDMERKGYRVIDRADVKIIEEKLKKVGALADKELDKLEGVKNEIIAEFKKRVDADGISAELDRLQSAKNKTALEIAARSLMMQIENAYVQRTLKQIGLLNNPYPRGANARFAEAVFDKELAESDLPEVKAEGWKRFAEEIKDVFASVSDRVARIDKGLARQLEEIPRRRVMRNSKYRKYFADYIDYIYKYVKPNERDFMLLSWYQMNGFYKAEMDVAKKYAHIKLNGKNLETLIAEKDAGLKQIWEDAIQAGLKVGWLEYYNPRRFKDAAGFIAAMEGTPQWSKIERMLKELDPDKQFTQEQKAIAINKWMRGYEARDLAIASPKNIKRRDLVYVSAPISKFYKNSFEALMDYADDMAKAVSVKEVFGVNAENLEQSIGHILLKVKEKHSLTHWEEEAVRKALVSFLQPKNPSEAVRQAKTWTYLLTITNPFSTLSQLEDLGLAAVKWGHANFMRALKTRRTDKWLTLENIGAETLNVDLNKEFENRTEKALRWILGKTAFTWMDRLGKESYINADFQARQEMVRKSPKKLMTELREMFSEEEAQSVLEALKTGDINNEALKSLLYYDISRVQPLSMMDMPYAYGRGGNLRYLYTLKSFALRRANFIFSEIQNKLHNAQTPEEYAGAVKELLGLLVGLVGYGALTNILKNLLLGRSVDLPEEAQAALLQNMMLTRYVVKRAADDPMDAFVNAVMPPGLGIINDVWKDTGRTIKGNQNLQDARVWTNVPLIGKEYYWWFGGGALKTKKDNKKKELFKIQGWAGNIR